MKPSGSVPWARLLLTGAAVVVLLADCQCDDESDPVDIDPLGTGDLIVQAITTGGMPDPDGYVVDVGSTTRSVPANGSVTFSGLTATVQVVTIDGLASNCEVASPVAGIATPTVPRDGSVTTTFRVECPILASLDVTIDGLPADIDGNVAVSGGVPRPIFETVPRSSTLTDLWPAEYQVVAVVVTAGGATYTPEPTTQDVVLAEGQTGSATVTYSGGFGSLDLVVSGLPAGTDADVSVAGPDGFAAAATASMVFTDLAPGAYTITAAVVASGSVTYGPDPLSQTVDVVGGQTTTATVTYAVTARAPIVFEDDFSVGDLWEETVIGVTGGATSTFETRSTGGASGGYRHMTHVFPGPGSITVQHLYAGGSYDPRVDGAIDHLNYSEWRIQFDPPFPTARIGSMFLVVQNGQVYTTAINGETSYANQTWERGEALQLTPADFNRAGLDFSDQGSEIFFGFLRSNSTGGTGLTTTHGIDDWRVEIIRAQN